MVDVMRIRVEPGGPRLLDADNYADFAVELAAGADEAALAGRVDVDGEQAWVDEPWLRALGGYDEAGRRERYEAMLDFARGRGWLGADGRIAAHVVHIGQREAGVG